MKAVDWGGERATELLNYFSFSPTAEPSPRLIQPSSHFFLAFWSMYPLFCIMVIIVIDVIFF